MVLSHLPNKIILKFLNYLLILISIFFLFIIDKYGDYIVYSKMDPNYWLNEINQKLSENYDISMLNLFNLSLNNQKYLNKSKLNFLYHFDKLNENTKNLIIRY